MGEDHVSVLFLPTYRSAISIVRLIRGPSLLQDSRPRQIGTWILTENPAMATQGASFSSSPETPVSDRQLENGVNAHFFSPAFHTISSAYPGLARWSQHDDDDFFVIRRFGILHARHLMLREELEDIKQQLLDTDQEPDDLERNSEYGLLPKQRVRKCWRRTVKQKLSAYGM